MNTNTQSVPPLRYPITDRLDVFAAVSRYLTTLGRAPSTIHLTARQWEQFRRESPRRPELGVVPAGNAGGDTAFSWLIGDVRYTVAVEIVELEPSEGVAAYRAQYARENARGNAPAVTNNTLSGAPSTHD